MNAVQFNTKKPSNINIIKRNVKNKGKTFINVLISILILVGFVWSITKLNIDPLYEDDAKVKYPVYLLLGITILALFQLISKSKMTCY